MVRKIVLLMMILFLTAPLCQAQCFGNCAASGKIAFIYQRRLNTTLTAGQTLPYNFAANVAGTQSNALAATIMGDTFTKVRLQAIAESIAATGMTLTLIRNASSTGITCSLPAGTGTICDTGEVTLNIAPTDRLWITITNNDSINSNTIAGVTLSVFP